MTKFSILLLMIGIPGSGKTRWVEQYLQTHPYCYVVSTDALRKELTGSEQCIDPSQNEWIHEEARKRVKAIIDNPDNYGGNKGMGPEIIVDSTNVDLDEWKKYRKLNASYYRAIVCDVPIDVAMEHQKNRERQVPQEIVTQKYNTLQKNKQFLSSFFNMTTFIH